MGSMDPRMNRSHTIDQANFTLPNMTFALSSPWLAWHLLATPALSLVGQGGVICCQSVHICVTCVFIPYMFIHIHSDKSVSGLKDMQIIANIRKVSWNSHGAFLVNSHGLVITIRALTEVLGIDNGIGLTPPRGWRSWNAFDCMECLGTSSQHPRLANALAGHAEVSWSLSEKSQKARSNPFLFSALFCLCHRRTHCPKAAILPIFTMYFASKDTDYPNTIPHDGSDGCRAGQISFGQWTADKFSGVHGSVSSHGRSLSKRTPTFSYR